jgi:signal peptidase
MKKLKDAQIAGVPADNTPVDSKKTKHKSVVNTIVNVVLIVAIVLAAISTYISFVASSGSGVPSFFGVQLLSVQTDSMKDTLMPGDLIVDVAVKDPKELRKGDIITYWTIIDGQRVLNTHRIVNIYDGGDFCIFET